LRRLKRLKGCPRPNRLVAFTRLPSIYRDVSSRTPEPFWKATSDSKPILGEVVFRILDYI